MKRYTNVVIGEDLIYYDKESAIASCCSNEQTFEVIELDSQPQGDVENVCPNCGFSWMPEKTDLENTK